MFVILKYPQNTPATVLYVIKIDYHLAYLRAYYLCDKMEQPDHLGAPDFSALNLSTCTPKTSRGLYQLQST